MNKQSLEEMVSKAINALGGKLMDVNDEFVVLDNWTQTYVSLKEMPESGSYTYVCSGEEFIDRARELGYCNGYKWGVEYETNGKKPDLPDDVLIHGRYDFLQNDWGEDNQVAGDAAWHHITAFRITDKRHKPVDGATSNEFKQVQADWYDYDKQQAIALPPAGVECEVTHRGQGGRWRRIEVIKHEISCFDDSARMACIDLCGKFGQANGELFWLYGVTDYDCKFRPHDWNRKANEERKLFESQVLSAIDGTAADCDIVLINTLFEAGCRFIENKAAS